jgi:hypothetical protein
MGALYTRFDCVHYWTKAEILVRAYTFCDELLAALRALADSPDQHRLGETPAHRQPSLDRHVRLGLPIGFALVQAVVGLQFPTGQSRGEKRSIHGPSLSSGSHPSSAEQGFSSYRGCPRDRPAVMDRPEEALPDIIFDEIFGHPQRRRAGDATLGR